MAIKKDQIGSTHYSKILDRNVTIKEGPTDDFYKLVGLPVFWKTKNTK